MIGKLLFVMAVRRELEDLMSQSNPENTLTCEFRCGRLYYGQNELTEWLQRNKESLDKHLVWGERQTKDKAEHDR